ncbi:hypothetical protein DAEQUDRAFT_672057 [Daedalea quercina L-15889]|uniref:CMP/dCMP-type deaminase domain-containing protein n=1 Tax=Daedalea quercina L-15889 TaxID=1314783 RepID=A0A165PBR1_9APHY|nr:hypothetical protein DAEQUDRAFT_672057 [Daedalea quercina L-15889]
MNKTQFYLSQCAEAASKSPMCFTLGAVMVKGGKVISSGYNHHRPHYDGGDVRTQGRRKPVSMHAEMHAIFSFTGMSPSFKTQVQGSERRALQGTRAQRAPPESRTKGQPTKGRSSGGDESSGSEGVRLAMGAGASASICGYYCEPGKAWGARRRDPRVNGADIYVARFTKNGMGSAAPCWRCLEWFEVVKVNSTQSNMYETHADCRLFAGLVRDLPPCTLNLFPLMTCHL